MTATRRALVPAIGGLRATPTSYYGVGQAATNPAEKGPPGSASMTFFTLLTVTRGSASNRIAFNRSNLTTAGWSIGTNGTPSSIRVVVINSTPAIVAVSALPDSYDGYNTPYLVLASYQNGVLSVWLNGVALAPVTLGSGFTPIADRPTCIGLLSSTSGESLGFGCTVADCGMLDAYDAASYVDPIFGNGGVGLSMRWLADLREGRYLTWPRAGTANADWYWAARDCVEGPGSLATTWVDRYSGIAMLKFGQPQGASFPARF